MGGALYYRMQNRGTLGPSLFERLPVPSTRPRRILSVLAAFALAVAGSLLAAAPAQAAGAQYYDGVIQYSTITNCVSIIQGSPYVEKGAGAYVGVLEDPDSAQPAVGTGFYVHVVVAGLGNACSGQRFVPGFFLPGGVDLDSTRSIQCYAGGQQVTGDVDCPQWGNVIAGVAGPGISYISSDAANANTWPLPQGAIWEFQFPVRATSTQSGTTMQSFIRMLDGNDSPTLTPSAPIYVFAGGGATEPSIIYSQPSTRAGTTVPNLNVPSATGLYSEGTVVSTAASGTIYLQRGTSPGSFTEQHSFAVSSSPGSSGWIVDTDWDDVPYFTPLASGTTYYWRLVFVPTGGATLTGATQSFSYPLGESSSVLSGADPRNLPVVKTPQPTPTTPTTGTTPVASTATCLGMTVTVDLGAGQKPTDGDDVILGTAGKDVILAGAGDDTICALGGDDTIDPGAGNDVIDGGAGTDTVSYASAGKGITLSLGSTKAQKTGGSGRDTVRAIENATGGTKGDRLTGSKGDNVLKGGKGNDRLVGGGGKDTLIGGPGRDTAVGGPGKDKAKSSEVVASVP